MPTPAEKSVRSALLLGLLRLSSVRKFFAARLGAYEGVPEGARRTLTVRGRSVRKLDAPKAQVVRRVRRSAVKSTLA